MLPSEKQKILWYISVGVPTLAGAVFFRSNREKAESINGMCGLSEKHGKSEILYAAPVEPCGRNGWHVQGDGIIKSAGKPVTVLLLTFLYSTAAGCPARPKSLRPNRTWHPVRE